jgi:Cu(I)/Ag(I) efflux system membrane protein CusA/SilA
MAVLLPIMWVAGAGSEIMQRIAVPMVGGMVSSTVVTLIVIPAIYSLLKGAAATRRAVDRKALTLTNPEANAATW